MPIADEVFKIIKALFKYGAQQISQNLNAPLERAVNDTAVHFKDRFVIDENKLKTIIYDDFQDCQAVQLPNHDPMIDEDRLALLYAQKGGFYFETQEETLENAREVLAYFKSRFEGYLLSSDQTGLKFIHSCQKEIAARQDNNHQTMAGDLQQLLAMVKSLAENLNLKVTGKPSRENVINHWLQKECDTRGFIDQFQLSGHLDQEPFEHPLLPEWRDFIHAEPWFQITQKNIKHLREKLEHFNDIPELTSLNKTLASVPWTYTYESIFSHLYPITQKHSLKNIRDSLSQLLEINKKKENNENVSILHDLQHYFDILVNSLLKPLFKLCFLITGSHGSGKTHFLTSLLEKTQPGFLPLHQRNYLLLPMHLVNHLDKTLPLSILKGINDMSGTEWKNIDEFAAFLQVESLPSQGNIKLVIVFDDLTEWSLRLDNFLGQLEELISLQSRYHSIRWLLTMPDTSFDVISYGTDFFKRYSSILSIRENWVSNRKKEANFEGWFKMDRLNIDWGMGIAILEEYQESESRFLFLPDINEDEDEQYESLVYLVNRPLIAWILVEWSETGPVKLESIVNLTYAGFVEYFFKEWLDKLKKQLARTRTPSIQAGHVIQVINDMALFFAQSRDFFPPREKLDAFLCETTGKKFPLAREHLERILQILEKEFLVKSEWNEELNWERRLRILLHFFWEWRLAQQLHKQVFGGCPAELNFLQELETWFSQVNDPIKNGIWEFLLMEVDRDWAQRNMTLNQQVWQLGLEADFLPHTPVWFAGPKSSGPIQDFLAGWALDTSFRIQEKYQLYAAMYFIDESTASQLSLPRRLEILQRHFPEIKNTDLSDYYLYIADHLIMEIDFCDFDMWGNIMPQFHGCEILELPDALAYLTIEKMFERRHDVNEVISCLFTYFKTHCAYARPYIAQDEKNKSWKRYYYREWVLYYFLRKLLRFYGLLAAMEILENCLWFNRRQHGINKTVGIEIQRETSIAFGYWYRTYYANLQVNHAEPEAGQSQYDIINIFDMAEEFLKIVTHFAESNDEYRRQLAFFMVYHTEITEERAKVMVNKIFIPVLQVLWEKPGLTWIKSRFASFFKDNLARKND